MRDFFQKMYRHGPDVSTGFCGLHYFKGQTVSSVRLALILVAASVISVVASTFVKKAMSAGDQVETDLQMTAQRINQEGPRLVGNGVRLDGAAAGPGRSITYLHTNLEASIGDVDKKAFETGYATAIRAQACSAVKALLLKDVTMTYSYRDRNGVPIGSVSVNKSHCK